jgi:hypothetical protein
MGQQLCACFEETPLEDAATESAVDARLRELMAGAVFHRSAYFGLSQQPLFVQLSEDCAALQWKTTPNTWAAAVTGAQHGEVDLTAQVSRVVASGALSLQLIGLDGNEQRPVFEIAAQEATVRDRWVAALGDLLRRWADQPACRPRASVTAAGASDKADYFRRREEEISAREKANNERKAKYAANGMKHTAQIMLDRA